MRYFLFLFIIILSGKVYSQDLSGKWHVISYEDEIIYFNKATDSLTYKNVERKKDAEDFKKMADFLIFPITYQFNNNKVTINFPLMDEIYGNFVIDKLNQKIIFTDKDGKKDELPYSFENEVLFLEMEMESGFIKLGLKKN
jgi:hypothetical protein